MPRRETFDDNQQIFLSLGSVNERLVDVELPPNEWSSIVGTFPDYLGQQGRIFGKRTLAKYADPIYGIWQFWMPYGYGVGVYQFDDHVDSGLWLTPSSKFPSLLLPPAIPFDGGGYTVDPLGNPWGGLLDIPNINTCIISFEELRTLHVSCGLSPTPSGTPNDTNGGPAGQGSNCRWEETLTSYNIATFSPVIKQYTYSASALIPPASVPLPLPPFVTPTNLTGTGLPLNGVDRRFSTATPPTFYQNTWFQQDYKTAVLDLTSIQPIYEGTNAFIVLTFNVFPILPSPPLYQIGYPLDVNWDINNGNFAAIEINMLPYLLDIPIDYGTYLDANGTRRENVIQMVDFNVSLRRRVCT